MLIADVKSTRPLEGPSDHAIRRSIFKHHAKMYGALGLGEIGVLRVRASAHIKNKNDDLSASKEHVLSQLELLHLRQVELKKKGLPNHIASVSFGDVEFARFAELWAEYGASVDVGQIQPPPAQVPAALEALLQDRMNAQTVAAAPKPQWLPSLLSHRDVCSGCAFYSDAANPDGAVIYRLLVAMHQPQRAMFL